MRFITEAFAEFPSIAREKLLRLLREYRRAPSPALKDKIQPLRRRLQGQLWTHYDTLRMLAPGLPNDDLNPGDAHDDRVVLPSSYNSRDRERFMVQGLGQLEVELRVGQLHDVLDHIRRGLGVRSLLTRHSRQQGHGYDLATRSQAAIRRAQVDVDNWKLVYRRVWASLANLQPTVLQLKGLQELRDADLIMLSEWMEDERFRREQLPWIWTVLTTALPAPGGPDHDGQRIREVVQEWNNEGMRRETRPTQGLSELSCHSCAA